MSKQSLNFSPYQPPPDVPSEQSGLSGAGTGKAKSKRPWFTRDASSFGGGYQSGGSGAGAPVVSARIACADDRRYLFPHIEPSATPQYLTNDPSLAESGAGASYAQSNGATLPADNTPASAWESRFGWRIDVLAAVAYLGGPVTALLLLILETTNDYVRFHAYQSALLTTPLLVLWFLMLVLSFWRWLRVIYLIASLLIVLYTAFRAFRDPSTASTGFAAARAGPGISRFYLPVIGDLADRWVGDE